MIVLKPSRAAALSLIVNILEKDRIAAVKVLADERNAIAAENRKLANAASDFVNGLIDDHFTAEVAILKQTAAEFEKQGLKLSHYICHHETANILNKLKVGRLTLNASINVDKQFAISEQDQKKLDEGEEKMKQLKVQDAAIYEKINKLNKTQPDPVEYLASILPEEAAVHIDAIREIMKTTTQKIVTE